MSCASMPAQDWGPQKMLPLRASCVWHSQCSLFCRALPQIVRFIVVLLAGHQRGLPASDTHCPHGCDWSRQNHPHGCPCLPQDRLNPFKIDRHAAHLSWLWSTWQEFVLEPLANAALMSNLEYTLAVRVCPGQGFACTPVLHQMRHIMTA